MWTSYNIYTHLTRVFSLKTLGEIMLTLKKIEHFHAVN